MYNYDRYRNGEITDEEYFKLEYCNAKGDKYKGKITKNNINYYIAAYPEGKDTGYVIRNFEDGVMFTGTFKYDLSANQLFTYAYYNDEEFRVYVDTSGKGLNDEDTEASLTKYLPYKKCQELLKKNYITLSEYTSAINKLYKAKKIDFITFVTYRNNDNRKFVGTYTKAHKLFYIFYFYDVVPSRRFYSIFTKDIESCADVYTFLDISSKEVFTQAYLTDKAFKEYVDNLPKK